MYCSRKFIYGINFTVDFKACTEINSKRAHLLQLRAAFRLHLYEKENLSKYARYALFILNCILNFIIMLTKYYKYGSVLLDLLVLLSRQNGGTDRFIPGKYVGDDQCLYIYLFVYQVFNSGVIVPRYIAARRFANKKLKNNVSAMFISVLKYFPVRLFVCV